LTEISYLTAPQRQPPVMGSFIYSPETVGYDKPEYN
jgi:hypothetical protein